MPKFIDRLHLNITEPITTRYFEILCTFFLLWEMVVITLAAV